MADRTTNDNDLVVLFPDGVDSFPIANGVTLGIGALVQLESGFLNHWDETGIFLGVIVSGEDTGRGTAASGTLTGLTSLTPDPRGYVRTDGVVLHDLAAVGGTPTQAKVGNQVWSADSDHASITLTTTGNAAIGRLWDFFSSAKVDVKLFPVTRAASLAGIVSLTNSTGGTANDALVDGFTQGAAFTDSTTGTTTTTLAAGVGVYNLNFSIDLVAAATAADIVTDFIIGHKFKLLESFAVVTLAVTTAAKAVTIGLEIGAVAVTNSAIVITSAAATPDGIIIENAGALSANTGSATDTLTLIGSSVTAHAEGTVEYVVRVQNMDTADAFAGIATQANLARTDGTNQNDNDADLAEKVNEILATQ